VLRNGLELLGVSAPEPVSLDANWPATNLSAAERAMASATKNAPTSAATTTVTSAG
jgi:hypothetical protein